MLMLASLRETAAGENSSAYFPLLDRISTGYFSSASTDSELYSSFLDVLQNDGHITNPEDLSTFNLALSLRMAAPRIEAHYQYYETSVKSVVEEKEACHNWILLDGYRHCNPSLDDGSKTSVPLSEPIDLPFERSFGVGKEAVLYGDPTSDSFGAFHQILLKAAQKGKIRYRLRYRRASMALSEPLPVSGYGVELALKRTDYIVIDDREATHETPQKPLDTNVVLNQEEDVADVKPLSTSELATLGLKAASFIMQSEKPLDTLVKLTQDLPKHSTSLVAHQVSEDLVSEHKQNRAKMAPAGVNHLWMNGAQLIERQMEPFTLVNMVRRERKLLGGVRELGLTGQQAMSLLGHKDVAAAKSNNEAPRFDWTDRTEDGRVIIWLNDLEADERYKTYPSSLKSVSGLSLSCYTNTLQS